MEAIKKQATKLREQVAKQQQAVMRHLGHVVNEDLIIDEAELQCHQKLQELYSSTKKAKHLQRNIVRGVEGFIATSSKMMEIARKLADDCYKYGADNDGKDSWLARAALHFGESHKSMEDERGLLLGVLGEQVCEPLRALITGAPLEDARNLAHRYDRIRHEVEAQAADVLRRRSKTKESDISQESCIKLKNSEARLTDLKSTMAALGREATAAMLSVEDQQQKTTSQRLLAMVDAERSYHQHILANLEKLYAEMILEEQLTETSLESITMKKEVNMFRSQLRNLYGSLSSMLNVEYQVFSKPSNGSSPKSVIIEKGFNFHRIDGNSSLSGSEAEALNQNGTIFIAKVIHPFDAEAEGELSLAVGDYVVIHQVGSTGWSEGDCRGKAGWFPSAYVKREEKAPASKIIVEANSAS